MKSEPKKKFVGNQEQNEKKNSQMNEKRLRLVEMKKKPIKSDRFNRGPKFYFVHVFMEFDEPLCSEMNL